MSRPVVVSIPHRLGKEEALARLRSGFTRARTNFGYLLAVDQETWSGDHLNFRVRTLGQVAGGTIDVAEDHVRLEVACRGYSPPLRRKSFRPSGKRERCFWRRSRRSALDAALLILLKPGVEQAHISLV